MRGQMFKAKRAADLPGMSAVIDSGRWSDTDAAAVYPGLSPASNGAAPLDRMQHPAKLPCAEFSSA